MPKSTTSLSLLLVICALVACGRCDRIESGEDRSHEAPTPASIDRGPLAQLPSGFVPVEMPGPPPPNHDPFPRVILSSVGVWIDGQSVAGDETSQLRALSDAVTTGWRRNPGQEYGTMHVWVDARSTVGELRPHLLRMAEQASVHVLGVAPRAPSADPSSDRRWSPNLSRPSLWPPPRWTRRSPRSLG